MSQFHPNSEWSIGPPVCFGMQFLPLLCARTSERRAICASSASPRPMVIAVHTTAAIGDYYEKEEEYDGVHGRLDSRGGSGVGG